MQSKRVQNSLRPILIVALALVTLAVAVPCSYAYYEQSFAQNVPMKTAQQCNACLKDADSHFAVSFEAPVWAAVLPEEPNESESATESTVSEGESSSAESEIPEPEPPSQPETSAYALNLAVTNGESAETFQTAFLTAALRFYSKQETPDVAALSITVGGTTYTAVKEAVAANTALAISGVRWQFRFLDGDGNEKTFSLAGDRHRESPVIRILLETASGAPSGLIASQVLLNSEQI